MNWAAYLEATLRSFNVPSLLNRLVISNLQQNRPALIASPLPVVKLGHSV
jgi:hypothetical protein